MVVSRAKGSVLRRRKIELTPMGTPVSEFELQNPGFAPTGISRLDDSLRV